MTDARTTRLTLVRHGESVATVTGVVGGEKGCKGLSDLGRRQAEALRDRLAATGELSGTDHLYASVLPRAIETAEILGPALGADLEIVQDRDLCEVHPGEADGLTWDEYRERFTVPRADGVPDDPYAPWAPGSESWAEFAVRAGRRLRRLASDHRGEHVVVACHGGVIEASLIALGEMPITRAFRTDVTNTSLTEWELRTFDDRDIGPRWTLVRFNDAAHLAGLGHPSGGSTSAG